MPSEVVQITLYTTMKNVSHIFFVKFHPRRTSEKLPAVADLSSLGVLTLVFFFTLLEIGMSLICINLPSLWFFVPSMDLTKIVRSISRKLSFSSLRSSRDRVSDDLMTNDSLEVSKV